MKRIVCLGGGPAGLYSAILFKKALPNAKVEVYERNRAGRYVRLGRRVLGQDHGGISRRRCGHPRRHRRELPSLGRRRRALRRRAPSAAAVMASAASRASACSIFFRNGRLRSASSNRFSREVDADRRTLADADLIVAADGVNSVQRSRHAAVFKPHIDVRKCRFIWLGTHQKFPAFTFAFEQHRARLVSDPCVSVQSRSLDGHRRDARGDLEGARPRPVRHGPVDRILRAAVRQLSRRPPAHEQRRATCAARPGSISTACCASAGIMAICVLIGDAAHTAHFRHRLGHEARDGGCDVAW